MSSTGPTTYQIDREQLVEEHRSFVRAIASELIKGLPRYIEFEELTACGNLGLVEAAQRYDPRYRTSFRTFAYYRIRGAMYDSLRNLGPLTRREYSRVRFASNANDFLQTAADDEQSCVENTLQSLDDEISAAEAAIEALIPIYLLSLDSEQLPPIADGVESVLTRMEHEELASLVRSLIEQLQPDDRKMIEEVYFRNRPISEVGKDLGVHKSWASRLHARAIKHLRELMENEKLLT